MSPTHRSSLRILSALAVGLLSLTSPRHAFAQEYQWNQTNTGAYDWFNAGNWTNGSVPNSTNAVVKFNQTGYLLAGNVTNAVTSNITVAGFANIDTANGGTLTLEGSGTITLKDNGTGVAYIDTKGINQTINNALVLDDPNGVRISGAKSAWLKGDVSGASAISLYGTVYLGGNNSFSGNVNITNLTAGQFIATATNAFVNASAGTYAFGIGTGSYNTASIGTVAQGTTTFANALDLGNSAAGNSRITFLSGGTNSVLEITTSSWTNTGGTGEIQINRAGTDSFVGYTASGVGTVKFSGTNFTVAKNISGGGGSSMLEFAPASGTQTWSGSITNFTQSIVKSGAGTVVLSGTNSTYTGQTLVNAGTLLVNGTNVQSGAGTGGGSATNGLYVVADGATLGGIGRIAGNATAANSAMIYAKSNGIVAPGASIGTLTLDGVNISGTGSSVLNMAGGAKFKFELAGDGSTADQIAFWNYVNGDFKLNTTAIDLALVGAGTGSTNTVTLFKFYSDSGSTLYGGANISNGLTLGTVDPNISGTPTLSYFSDRIDLTYSTVPEPSTFALLGLGGLALGACCLRRRNAEKHVGSRGGIGAF